MRYRIIDRNTGKQWNAMQINTLEFAELQLVDARKHQPDGDWYIKEVTI